MQIIKVSLPMQEQILELFIKGHSSRKIAKALRVSRNTVRRVIERGKSISPGASAPEWSKHIDWESVRSQASQGVPLNILSRENAAGKISYSQFRREYYKKYPSHPAVTMKLLHKPGEKCFFDYTEGINIIDRDTGEVTKTHLACGVLAMSSLTYGEFTLTQKRDDLMRSMERAFRYFGGVTPYVTLDNQRAVVDEAHWYDPNVNAAFVEFANHWGFAVIPARPYRPRDKGGNECAIGVIQRQFYHEVRDKNFYSLQELNDSFKEYLLRLNNAVMKDWGVTRNQRFEGERQLLKACPAVNWEPSEWKTPKVHPDCHIQVLKKFYSVPYTYVGRQVRVRITAKMIEVFDQELSPVCCHLRLLGKENRSTNLSHYPEEKLALTQYSVQTAKRDAERIGPATLALINSLLDVAHPLRFLRRAQGILRLQQSGKVTDAGLEHGAQLALSFKKPYYQYIYATAQHFDKCGNKPKLVSSAPSRDPNNIYLHNQSLNKET